MKRFFSVVVLVAIFFVGCAQRDVAPKKAFLFKSKRQLQVTEREALAGDNAAAKRMADYYYFAKNDRADCIWWYKLAASRGDPVAKENLKKLLQESQ
jgi:TPR repeat protein